MIDSVEPLSCVLWAVAFFAAGMYPLGFMMGAPCSPCCRPACQCGIAANPGSACPPVYYEDHTRNSWGYSPGRWCCDKKQPQEVTIRISANNTSSVPYIFYRYRSGQNLYRGGLTSERGPFKRLQRHSITHDCNTIAGDYVLQFGWQEFLPVPPLPPEGLPEQCYYVNTCGYIGAGGWPRIWSSVNFQEAYWMRNMDSGQVLSFPDYALHVKIIVAASGTLNTQWFWAPDPFDLPPRINNAQPDNTVSENNIVNALISYGLNFTYYSVFTKPACDITDIPEDAIGAPAGQAMAYTGNHFEHFGLSSPGASALSYAGSVELSREYEIAGTGGFTEGAPNKDANGNEAQTTAFQYVSGIYPACDLSVEVV